MAAAPAAPPSAAAPARPGLLRHPLAALRRRIRHFWYSRLRPTDTLVLTQRNVYILPSRAGWMLALTLLVLLVGAINYQLNLGYLLTFLLAGCAVAGMHICHGTLRGLGLHLQPPVAVHAATPVTLDVRLHANRKRPRYAIGLAVLDAAAAHWAWADVPGNGSASVQVAFTPQRRGEHPLPLLTAETRYPLGTFRVWTVWRPATTVLVYPAPERQPPPLPPGEPRAGGMALRSAAATGEFDGVRAWQRGDPMKLVVWKKFAKSGELVSRDAQHAQRVQLWLDHAQTGIAELEARLSRLTAWVLAADRLGVDYGLRLPGACIQPASGEGHKQACLEALARA